MTRQKTVYPTRQIAHLWAHKTQSEARNQSGNFYFRDDTIYSYGLHFPIARHVKTGMTGGRGMYSKTRKTCVFFTTRGYSTTTAKHLSFVRCAIPHESVGVFHLPNVLSSPKEGLDYHKACVKEARGELKQARGKVQRILKYRALLGCVQDAVRYCEWFGYSSRFAALPANFGELNVMLTEYDAMLEARRNASDQRRQARWDRMSEANRMSQEDSEGVES